LETEDINLHDPMTDERKRHVDVQYAIKLIILKHRWSAGKNES